MTVALIITLISALANIILGLFAYFKNARSATNRFFLILSLSIAFWLVINQLAFLGFSKEWTLFFTRFVMTLATVQAVSFFLLSYTFPRDKTPLSKKFLVGYGIIAIGVMILSLTPYLFADVEISGINVSPVPAPGIVAFLIVAVGSVVSGAVHLIRKYFKAKGLVKVQIGYMLLGAGCMFAALILFNLIFVLILKTSALAPLGSASTMLFTGAIAYAIVRHRFLDIKAVVARSVAYALLLGILSVTYVGILFGISQLFFRNQAGTDQVIVYTILALFVAITYQPLKVKLEQVTDSIFYKNQYRANDLIANITNIMAETLELEDLANQSLGQLLQTMHITRGGLWVYDGNEFGMVSVLGEGKAEKFATSDERLKLVGGSDHIIVIDEGLGDGHNQILRELNASIAVPMYAGDILQGVLLLGDKQSGDIYTEKDLNVLTIISPGLATAVENARSYQQISEFNQTLKSEVEKATKDLQVANEKLSKNNEKLRQLDELKDEFISVTSHELRTPLTSIKGYLWMAMHGKKRDDKFHDYMNRAYVSTERLITMVNDTLDVSRIESGRVELSIEPTNLNQLAQDVVDDLKDRANQQHQQLILKKTRALPLVDCDPTKIYQVLTNLVGNAVKFTPPGGKIKVDFTHRGSQVTVRVQDNGPGIRVSDQEKLFQKFSRLETTIPGTGLGLYLCLQIIRLSKGRIWIESQEGRGAAFLFTLPVSKTQSTKIEKHPQQFRNVA